MFLLILQKLTIEFFFDLVYFPIWWYTGGVKNMFFYCKDLVSRGNISLSPGLCLKNIFVPMFGQHDLQGRLVSFFMRFVNVIGRTIALLFWILVVFILFILWLVFPLFVVYMLIMSLF